MAEFSRRYITTLEKWCEAWSIQNFDAQDVIQETLLAIMHGIQGFERRGTGSSELDEDDRMALLVSNNL